MLHVSVLQLRLLRAVYQFRYLTHSQMAELGIGHIQHLRSVTKKLCSLASPVLDVMRFPVEARIGHVENVYFLTPSGASVVAESVGVPVEDLDFRPVTCVFYRDYWHRKRTIDVHIRLVHALQGRAHVEVERIDRYFEMCGANHAKSAKRLHARSRAEFEDGKHIIIPDMNVVLRGKRTPHSRALYCLELVNGRNVKRVLRQILKHALAMNDGALARKYGMTARRYRVLFVCSEPSMRDIICARFSEAHEHIGGFREWFYFASLEDTAESILGCFKQAGERAFYNILTGKPVS